MPNFLRNRGILFDNKTYSPLDLSSVSYLNAKNTTSITNATGVSQWSSLSGNGHYTEPNGASQPIYNSSGMDGQPSILFDGANDKLSRNRSNGVFTLIFLVKIIGNGFLFASGSDYIWTGNGSTFEINRSGGGASGKNIASGWLNNNKAKIVIWRFDGTHNGNQVFVNGILKNTTNVIVSNPGIGNEDNQFATILSRGTGGFLNGYCSYFNDRNIVLTQEQINKEVKFILREFLPTARIGSDGLPILDSNQDLTY